MIKLSITNASGTTEITSVVPTMTLAGDYMRCARTLDFGVLSSSVDKSLPVVPCELGYGVTLSEDEKTLLSGFIMTRAKSTDGSVIDVSVYDRGFYVKKNTASRKFTNQTPEAITKAICADFNIKVGSLAATGVKISRTFIAISLYQIIQTAYTLAAQKNGKSYQIRFVGDSLTVVEKGVVSGVVIAGGSNLMSSSTTESIADMINQVQIVDSSGKVINTVKDAGLIAAYGLMQEQIKQIGTEDLTADAQKLLAENGVNQKITLNNIGNVNCITGNSVVVQEPYTKVCGLFFIDSDTHTWKNGVYLNMLVVNFKRIMDEQEAGEAIASAGSSGTWTYNNEPG